MNCKQLVLAFVITGSVFTATAQTEGVSIKSTVGPPDPSAMLDVQSPSKGVLIPRVLLLSSGDATTIVNPANSLLVYSTGNVAMPAGYYYNSGPSGAPPVWVRLAGGGSGNDLWTLSANNTDIFRQSGNVGINTPTPLATLDVNGNLVLGKQTAFAPISSGLMLFRRPSDGGVSMFAGMFSDREFAFKSWVGSGFFSFWTAGNGFSEKMRLDYYGKLGLGTTSPTEGLHIKQHDPGVYLENVDGTKVKVMSKQGGIHLISTGCATLFLDSDGSPATHGSPPTFDIYTGTPDFTNANMIFSVHNDGTVWSKTSTYSSDSTLKANIISFNSSSLSKILQLRAVNFNWKDDSQQKKQTGFIAQELELVLPELVSIINLTRGANNGNVPAKTSKAVNYIALIPHLVKAMQEQQVLIEQLQQQNTLLTNRIQALENQ